jgi:ribose/xylose/arabinose/galactoside ABC-type transport system permease subunit
VSEPISGELPMDRAASAFPTGQLLSKYGLLGFLVANALVVSVLSPAFLKPENIANVLTQAAPLGIVVLGQTFVLLVGGVDLSVASVMATSAVIATGFAATDNRMVPVIFAAAIGLGLVVGLVNGFLVAKRNVSPFLATLATTVVLQGLRFLYTQGSTGSTLPSAFALMGAGRFLGVPVNLIALVVLAAIFGFVLLVSKHGRKIYLVGNNARGAILVGLPTDRISSAATHSARSSPRSPAFFWLGMSARSISGPARATSWTRSSPPSWAGSRSQAAAEMSSARYSGLSSWS